VLTAYREVNEIPLQDKRTPRRKGNAIMEILYFVKKIPYFEIRVRSRGFGLKEILEKTCHYLLLIG